MSETKTIKEQIDFLIGLQVIDREIYALNMEKKEKPEEIEAIEKALEAQKTGIKEEENNLKTLQVKLKDKEVTLQQKEEQIKKLQTQLYQLKTNKEYSAMLTEIEGVKADNSITEEEIIKLMDETEMDKKKLMQEKELFKNEEASAQKEKTVVDARMKEIDSKLAEFSAKRKSIVPNITQKVLARYERVLENRAGLAIVPIECDACGGCHMNLPPQVISEAKLREDIIICQSCSRILYI